MLIDLTIRNYRCFPDSSPARISIRKGFTAFLGPNNSGKSSLLKFFFEFRPLFALLGTHLGGDFLLAIGGQIISFGIQGIRDVPELFANTNNRDLLIDFDFTVTPDDPPPDGTTPTHLGIAVRRGQLIFGVTELRTINGVVAPGGGLQYVDGAYAGRGNTRLAHMVPMQDALRQLANTVYLAAFRNAINIGGDQPYYDIQVGQQFLRAWKGFKAGASKQNAEAAHRLTQDIRRIFEFQSLEINTAADDQSLLALVDGRMFRLDEIGSGLSQFVLVLATIATRQQDFILIDEPELNLHPSLQLDFLTTVGSYARAGVFFGTHSVGLARSVGQHIYALRREREGESRVRLYEAIPRLAEFLGELSFSGYRELGFQKVLLVEGPHDVTAVQQWLRLLGKDHTIVLLLLGGSSMINANREAELAEVCRISNNIRALIDSERAAADAALSADRQGFVATCTKLQIACHVLDRRALENYLPDRAIKEVKGNAYRELTPYEHLTALTPAWGKAENWRIARAMTKVELDASGDLGSFLESL